MDFFTFIIIAVFIYNVFGKKDKPPQRRQRSAEDYRTPANPSPTPSKKKESFFESLERQIRESAEKLEQELQGNKPIPRKPVTTPPQGKEYRTTSKPQEAKNYQGQEGYSDYDSYTSKQGTQGTEGTQGEEGTWGTEGKNYATKQKGMSSAIEQSEIGAGPGQPKTEKLASLGFSPSAAVQGIIWAEILKEPRGRRGLSRR